MRLRRRNGIERIERRIAGLREQAAWLLEREEQSASQLEKLKSAGPSGRLRVTRRRRALERTARRLDQLRTERGRLAEDEIRTIMLLLREQSSRTRERLDRELERMVPLEQEWERLRSMFECLEETIGGPGLRALARHWQGGLDIPDFPVTESQGYIKPFPPQAILF